jgi:hypothetical protein
MVMRALARRAVTMRRRRCSAGEGRGVRGRHAVALEDELVPYPKRAHQQYKAWLPAQETEG